VELHLCILYKFAKEIMGTVEFKLHLLSIVLLVHYCSVLYEYQDTSTLYLDSIVYPSPSSASFSNNDDLILFFN